MAAPACKSDVKYNFSRASAHDELVHGSARPGAASQRCFNPEDKVTQQEVDEWAQFMGQHGIKRVVSLLTSSELETYAQPLHAGLAQHFSKAVNVDPKAPGAAEALVKELEEAAAAQEKVVVHCWGGGGRTGQALATWLMRKYDVPEAEVAEQVEGYAKAAGASRRVELPLLRKFMGQEASTPEAR